MDRYSWEAGEMAGTHGMNLLVYGLNSVNTSFTSEAVSHCYYSFSLYIQTIDTYIWGGWGGKNKENIESKSILRA